MRTEKGFAVDFAPIYDRDQYQRLELLSVEVAAEDFAPIHHRHRRLESGRHFFVDRLLSV